MLFNKWTIFQKKILMLKQTEPKTKKMKDYKEDLQESQA